tara:strand:- start:2048 stop:2440 length:393 start_codon:yes stop_codon:yes gene_type:complete
MRITQRQLRQIIREELSRATGRRLSEAGRLIRVDGWLGGVMAHYPDYRDHIKKILGDLRGFRRLVIKDLTSRLGIGEDAFESSREWMTSEPFITVAEKLVSKELELPGLSPASAARLEQILREAADKTGN